MDRVDIARELGAPTGSASNNPRQAWYVDLGNGAFLQAEAAYNFVKQAGIWVAWDGSMTLGTGAQVEVVDGSGHVLTMDSSGRPTILIASGQSVALAAGSQVIGHVVVDSGAIGATLSAETTKVIGTVNISSGQTVGLAAGSAVIGHVVVDSGSVTTTTAAPSTIYNGKKTVTTAGTSVVLASSQSVKSVTVKALSTNTGLIYVGDGSVSSLNGFQLAAGDTISMDISDLSTVHLDSSVSGEGVTYIGVN